MGNVSRFLFSSRILCDVVVVFDEHLVKLVFAPCYASVLRLPTINFIATLCFQDEALLLLTNKLQSDYWSAANISGKGKGNLNPLCWCGSHFAWGQYSFMFLDFLWKSRRKAKIRWLFKTQRKSWQDAKKTSGCIKTLKDKTQKWVKQFFCQKEESKFTRSWTQRNLVWCYFQIWMKTECQHFTKSAVGASQNMMLLWSNNVCHGQHKAAAIMHLALSPHIWSSQNGGICQD